MCPILNYGEIRGDVLYYPGSETGGAGGMIDRTDESKVWNNLQSRTGSGKGVYLEVILGIGAHRSVNPYAPLHKSLWYILSEKIGFEIVQGSHLGTLFINMKDVLLNKERMLELGSAFLFFAARCKRDPYTTDYAYADFGVVIKKVIAFQQFKSTPR